MKWLTPRVQQRAAPSWSDGFTGGRSDPARGQGWRSDGWRGASEGSRGASEGGGRRAADFGDTGRADAQALRAAQRFDRGIAYRIGQNVAHARFGEGVIVNIEGSGTDARVQVNFGREGVKWLALSVAKLQAV